jgi:hypothetical protein
MSVNPVGVGGPADQVTAGKWPTDEEILALAKNDKIPLYAEAYAIAQQYNRISQALTAQLGTKDLNWCGFAKWSSKAIGSELRLDEHSPFFDKLVSLYSNRCNCRGGSRSISRHSWSHGLAGSCVAAAA